MNRNVWRLIAHHENREVATRWSRQNDRIALGGDKVGDIRIHKYESASAIEHAMRWHYSELGNFKSGGFSLWNFCNGIEQGDLIILKGDSNWVAEVTGDYYFDDRNFSGNGDYFHRRAVRFTQLDPAKLWKEAGGMKSDGGSIYRALVPCAQTVEF